ncbi:MAG: nitrate reductase [Deltaproteobacteria bacterium HGW-Deltaproteobacteria-15]|jgi:thiosulfate reductase/polysulfide reductase chain A|nr:MAG: nitrate reductase [Deltaproteobacteria bacterium HGW-Deltaproteobacteria-15]
MSANKDKGFTRRGFLKVSGAAGAAAAIGGHAHVLKAFAKGAENNQEPDLRNAYSVCDMCFNKCGVIARVDKSGIVRKLDPNPKFAKSRGMLCARGNAGIAQLYGPDRLKYPLLRKGERGGGQWQRLTWDEALDLAAERLEKIGKACTRCGVLFMAGTDMQSSFVHRFASVFGSFNVISHESNCLVSVNRAFVDTFGEVPNPDLLHCKYVIMAGANRFEALVTPDTMDLMTAMQQGCKLVVLDPRFTKTAALAHEYHPIRPGTDMAFFLAVAHVIIEEDLYDRKFAEERLNGLDQLSAHVKQYTPEWAEKECEIPAPDIRRIARELAEAAPAAMVYPGRRSSDYEDSTQIRRSFAIVNALLGNFDQKGGLTIAQPIPLKGVAYDAPWYDDNPKDRVEAGRSKMMFEEEGSFKHARDAVIEGKPYPVKGFFTYKTNPMATGANRQKTIEMIRKLDFMVSVDIVMSDTAWMADLVLPAPTYLERQDPISPVQGVTAGACIVTRDPVVPALYESKPVFWIMKELAKRLDLGEFFDFTMEDYRKKQLAALPEAQAALEKDGVYYIPGKLYGVYEGKPIKTTSKKIELYSQRYKQAGLDPMPVYRPPREVPADRFRLVVGRNGYITQGSSTNNSLLSELAPENTLWIHPGPAKKMGLHPEDSVEVSSKAGKGTLKVRITEETRPDTVYMDSGFGVISKGLSRVHGKGASIVEILEDYNDEISGNMAMHETLVSIRKV